MSRCREGVACFICAEKRAIVDGEVNCHRVFVAEAVKEYLESITGDEWTIKHLGG